MSTAWSDERLRDEINRWRDYGATTENILHSLDNHEPDLRDVATAEQLAALRESVVASDIDAEFKERSRLVSLESVALCIAVGASHLSHRGVQVTADPEEPDDNNPLAVRTFYVTIDETTYTPGTGHICGVHPVKYRLLLERVEEGTT